MLWVRFDCLGSETINDVVGIFLMTIGMSFNDSKLLSLVSTNHAYSNKSNEWVVFALLIQLFKFNAVKFPSKQPYLTSMGSPWVENFELLANFQPGKILSNRQEGFITYSFDTVDAKVSLSFG